MTDQILAPRRDLGVIYGNSKPGQITLVAATWDDPGVNPVQVSVNGGIAQTITMNQVGTDYANGIGGVTPAPLQGQAGWVGSIDLTLANAFPNLNPFTVTQTGRNSTTGNFRAAPAAGQNHTVWVSTCFNGLTAIRGASFNSIQEPAATGLFDLIRQDDEDPNTPPVSALAMVDDVFGYVDQGWVDDTVGTGATGHRVTDAAWNGIWDGNPPNTSLQFIANSALAYDYALFYMIMLGMGSMDDTSQVGSQGERSYTWLGRNEDRLWCFANLPFLPQYGDHEVTQDFGMKSEATAGGMPGWIGGIRDGSNPSSTDNGTVIAPNGVTASGEWARYAWNAAITEVYHAFLGPLQGVSIASADANANHWEIDLGDIRLVAADAMYNADGAGGATMNVMLGQNQITDLKASVNAAPNWVLFLSPFGGRTMNNLIVSTQGYNWPLANMVPAEWASLITDSDGLGSVSDKCVVCAGDIHHLYAETYNDVGENGLLWCMPGTINGSSNVGVNPIDINNKTVLYDGKKWGDVGSGKASWGHGAVRASIIDSDPPVVGKTMVVWMVDGKATNDFVWGLSKVFQGDSNMTLKFREAEADADSKAYKLDGTEIVGFDTNSDPLFPAVWKNYGKTFAEIQALFADLGLQLGLLPGGATARTEILLHTNTAEQINGGDFFQTITITPKPGLMGMTARISWSRSVLPVAIQSIGADDSGGAGRRIVNATGHTFAENDTAVRISGTNEIVSGSDVVNNDGGPYTVTGVVAGVSFTIPNDGKPAQSTAGGVTGRLQIAVDATIGVGGGRFKNVHAYDISVTEDFIDIYFDFMDDAATVQVGSNRSIGKNFRDGQNLNAPIQIGVDIYDEEFSNPNESGLLAESISFRMHDSTPREQSVGIGSFSWLKAYYIASEIQNANSWIDAPNPTNSLDIVAPGSFGVDLGEAILLNKGAPGNTSMTGAWPVPDGTKDMAIFILGGTLRAAGNPSPILELGDRALGAAVAFTPVIGQTVIRMNGQNTIFQGAGTAIDLAAVCFVIPAVGSASTAQFKYILPTDIATVVTQTPTTGVSQFNPVEQLFADWEADNDGLSKFAPSVQGILVAEFSEGIPDDIDVAFQYMAQRPTFGPYPGWHAIT